MEKLKTIKLQGRDYVQVSTRIQYFRENVENGSIQTTHEILGDKIIFTAKVFIDDKCIATAHSMKNITKEFELEKAETRAIGRALGIAGIGIECGVSSYDEIRDYIATESAKLDNEYLDKIKE